MSVTVNSLINHGYLPPSKHFHGPWSSKAPKLLLGVTIGYTIGQVSKNLTKIKQKFIILDYEQSNTISLHCLVSDCLIYTA
jgi:hypothetical protein